MKKIALVTGSSKGIGKGIAKTLIVNGYTVYINGRNQNDVDSTVEELGESAISLCSDFSIEKNVSNGMDRIIKEHGVIDLLVTNIGSGKSILGWDVPLEEFKRVFEVNFFSAVLACNYAITHMKKRGGSIVAISSIAGCEILKGPPVAYTVAKTALLSYIKSLSKEVSELNIRVNAISPGNILFDGGSWDSKLKSNDEGVWNYIKENVALKSFGKPDDIARGVLFIEESEFMTGSNLVIDGGQINKLL